MVAEPSAQWLARPPCVVDCGVLVAVFLEEDNAVEATTALVNRALHAPNLLPFEFANVARNKSRAGADPTRITDGLQAFEASRIELHHLEPQCLHELALEEGLTAYDAAYLALAIRLKAPLLTFDHRLSAAAERRLFV
jgi:predicted nucleic acid-binding protein